jgi:hypothetical protein
VARDGAKALCAIRHEAYAKTRRDRDVIDRESNLIDAPRANIYKKEFFHMVLILLQTKVNYVDIINHSKNALCQSQKKKLDQQRRIDN